MPKAQLISVDDPNYQHTVADIMLKGGIVGAIWAHHLYFLACNAFDTKAVRRLNKLKSRPSDQVFASPGAVEEAEEFADFNKNPGLKFAAAKMSLNERDYLELLYKKLPIAIELYSKVGIPGAITFVTGKGKTVWIAGHTADKSYSKLLDAVRNLRLNGNQIAFAGTSLNLHGENTLTVRELDKVTKTFSNEIDAIVTHPKRDKLKKLRYGTSSSVVSFIEERPKLIRLGSSSIMTLRKYIPGLEISPNLSHTRK